jgi:recombination protein RecA
MPKTDKIQQLVDEANKEWGDGTLIIPELGGTMVNEHPEVIPTGCEAIDKALGVGGLPMGRIVEVMGQEASGKTTVVLHVIANAQKMGKRAAFIDVEHALDTDRAKAIGVDFEKLAISQPDSGEQALELLEFLIRSGQFGVIVVDSVAALIPKAEIEGEMTDANIGSQARMMGKIMRKITAPTNKMKVLVIFTNQVRAKLGGFGFIPQTTTPGGNALKFYASMRMDMVRTGNKYNSKKELLYTTHQLTVKKNKLAPPARIAEFKITEKGIVNENVNLKEVEAETE